MTNYLGCTLLIEEDFEGKREYPEPPAGEYVCVRQTPNGMSVINTSGSYGSHEDVFVHLAGKRKYKILDAGYDAEFLARLAGDLEQFALTKRYIGSVMSGAHSMAKRLRKIITDRDDKSSSRTVTIPCGKATLVVTVSVE